MPLTRQHASILSPLRYPGSKRRLAAYISKALDLNCAKPSLFVEPFAGGASVALQLLNDGKVESIGLADADPLVASFWQAVFFDTDWLVNEVTSMEVTLEKWDSMKRGRHQTRRERALACIFLNRTSFSGILAPSAGPIGGRKALSPYDLACRFPHKTLTRRIRQAAALRDKVKFVWCAHWPATLSRIRAMVDRGTLPREVFYYLDPPFIEKANRLYNVWFERKQHEAFRDHVVKLSQSWIVSYDSAPQVEELYRHVDRQAAHVEVLYTSAISNGGRRAYEAIVTNLARLPEEARLWRSSDEWRPTREGGDITNAAAS